MILLLIGNQALTWLRQRLQELAFGINAGAVPPDAGRELVLLSLLHA